MTKFAATWLSGIGVYLCLSFGLSLEALAGGDGSDIDDVSSELTIGGSKDDPLSRGPKTRRLARRRGSYPSTRRRGDRGSSGGGAWDCRPDEDGFCTSRVVRYQVRDGDAELRLNTRLGSVVVIEFSGDVDFSGVPAVGNGAFFDVEAHKGASRDDKTRILVRPRLPESAGDIAPEQFYGVMSNIQAFFVDAPTLNMKIRIAPPEKAVYQVKVDFPDRRARSRADYERIYEEAIQLKNEYEIRQSQLDLEVAEHSFVETLEGMARRFECRNLSKRKMRELLIVRIKYICRVGANVYIGLSIKNRRRSSIFHLNEVRIIESGRARGVGEMEVAVRFKEHDITAPFKEEVSGVAGFRLDEDSRQFGPWNLSVIEDGGANRVVTVDDIGF